MSDNANGAAARIPASFWTISGLSLLWNAYGGVDYTMTKLRNMDFLTAVTGGREKAEAMLAAIDALPVWATALWALGVWGSVLGSVLLLLRSRHAVTAFLISMIGAVLSFAYQFTTPMGAEMASASGLIMIAVILVAVVFFWWFAKRSAAQGILR